ncbi:class I SAM-dependent methyltransferase [Geothrix sp. 21YS21S-4]|uniref:class I SAM-dependent methyltransferase n=1 Tax=Geothrix sp. 21YS21S-4 TaxID=3068889 RepID=UPI0027BA1AA2|nr:class I SAM-dependent methyltransferase [Geothrix sp. 21YS21S-4]
MAATNERDYVLGTHREEIERLGLQHRVWRPHVLECWRRAGITTGSKVFDVGAGPGYATLDLAEIVGPSGEVHAVERSGNFVQHARAACAARGLEHVRIHEHDLMGEPLDIQGMDATWCRWVASFVPDPARLVATVARALKPGGVAIFHEYLDYRTWRLAPPCPPLESFVAEVMASWRASGGEPDVALSLPSLLEAAGLSVKKLEPKVFVVPPTDFIWKWPSSFVENNLQRLLELGRVDRDWVESVRTGLREAATTPGTVMITPMVLEIVAERRA